MFGTPSLGEGWGVEGRVCTMRALNVSVGEEGALTTIL